MDRLIQSGIRQWFRYVDDTIIPLEPAAKIEDILNILNNFHRSISFIHEPEEFGSLLS